MKNSYVVNSYVANSYVVNSYVENSYVENSCVENSCVKNGYVYASDDMSKENRRQEATRCSFLLYNLRANVRANMGTDNCKPTRLHSILLFRCLCADISAPFTYSQGAWGGEAELQRADPSDPSPMRTRLRAVEAWASVFRARHRETIDRSSDRCAVPSSR